MNKKFFLPLVLVIFIIQLGCKSENGAASDAGDGAGVDSTLTGQQIIDQLKAQAVDESDILGRLQPTARVLQEEYTRSEAVMEGLKKVKVEIGGDCVLSISNAATGELTKVNLKDLDRQGFSLIPDLNEGDFPGLRIQTTGLKETVALYKGGDLVLKKNELVIYLADRSAIERITPYMLQALNICQGVQLPE
ncbi:MAG: hypothetical protein WA004_14075 [Saprospiraceae bacterium]